MNRKILFQSRAFRNAMKVTRKAVNSLWWRVFELTARKDAEARRLVPVFDAGRRGLLSAVEAERVAAIERIRDGMLASGDVLERADDGCELTVAEACEASQTREWSLMLFRLVRDLEPCDCLELGTCVGVSAMYEGTALEMNGEGSLVTIELSPARVRLARRNLAALGLDSVEVVEGSFDEVLADMLERMGCVDFAFIDGHHDEEATKRYFARVAEYAPPGSWLLLDDIRWSSGMTRAWQAVRSDSRVLRSYDLGSKGLCVLGEGPPKHYRVFI